jgi:putative ABC transport system permease protein
VSLGAGLPLARPARSVLTLAAVVLGVTTVTFATGLASTLTGIGSAGHHACGVTVYVGADRHGEEAHPRRGDRQTQSLLAGLPGATGVTARADDDVLLVGSAQVLEFEGRRGSAPHLDTVVTRRRWTRGTDEVLASSAFLRWALWSPPVAQPA